MKKTRLLNLIQKAGNSLVILTMMFSQFGWAVGSASAAAQQDSSDGTISGTINDAGGSPITGVSIQVRAVLKSDGSQAALTTTNPADGTYTLTGLPLDTALAVVASDEDPDTDGYSLRYYNNVSLLPWAESIMLTSGVPDRSGVDIKLFNTPDGYIEQMTFNVDDGHLLSDVQLRKAIAYGTDRQAILDNAFVPNGETGEIQHSLVLPWLWYKAANDDPLLTVYDFNPTQAGTILDAAGWTDTDEDGIRENASDEELVLDFVTTTLTKRVASAELFKTQMAAIGILVNVHTYPPSDFFSGDPARSPLNSGDFDIAEFVAGGFDDDTLLDNFNSGNEYNYGGYSNSTLDGYYNAARDAKVAGESTAFKDNALLWQYEFSADLPALPMFTRVPIPVPGDFGKTSPSNGATNQSINPTLSWGASSNADYYEYCIDTTDDTTCDTTWISIGADTSVPLTGLNPGATYYWQVRATNNSGTTYADGSDTAWWSFTVLPLPGDFSKSSPENGAIIDSTNVTLTWEVSSNPGTYWYCIDTLDDDYCNPELAHWTPNGTNTSVSVSDLTPGTTYYWQVGAVNDSGTKYADDPIAWWSFTILLIPTNVQASDGTYTDKVLVSWDASSGATSYEVYRATSELGTKVLLGSPTDTNFDDTTATPGVNYYYWVKACTGVICSDTSAFDTGWRKLSPPTNMQASDGTYTNKVLVTWDAPTGATSYEVYRATSELGAKDLLGSPAGTSFDDTTATPAVTYFYWVKACTGVVCSDYTVTNTGWRKLSPPTNVQASDGTYTNKVLMTWDASTGATSYKVYRATSELGAKDLLGSPTGSTFDDTTATPAFTYFYWVKACTGVICSDYSVHDTGWRQLSPPTNVQASDGTFADKVLVNWIASSGATSYKVYRAASAAGTKSLLGSPAGTSFNDTTASTGVIYFYWVTACSGANCTDYSTFDNGWRKLSAPTNVLASDGTYADKVVVNWTASSGASSYKIYRSASAAGTKSLLGSPTATTFTDTTGTAGTTYYYWVTACDGLGCSNYSAYNSGWRSLISAPTHVQASDGMYADKILVSWTASSGATLYRVYRATTSTGTKSLLGSPTATTFNDTTGITGTTYYYWVIAYNGTGYSGLSAPDTGWRSVVSAPTNVQASDGSYTDKVLVSWTASSGATSYKVYRATSATGTKSLLGSPVVTSFNDTTATIGVTYTYWVVASLGTGFSGYSLSNTGWRKPTPPINVTASDGTYTDKVTVNWTASTGATSYKVYRTASAAGTKSLLGSPTGTSFDDTTGTPGVTYYYWVTACNGANCSDTSAYDTGWRKLSPPTHVQASDGTYTDKVVVSWTASSGATLYKIYRAATAAGSKSLLGTSTGTTFNDITATPGFKYYYYWVVAYNSTGYSGLSASDTGWRR